MKKKSLRLSEVYRLLEPGPVVMATTAGPERPNIMTLSWHMMMEFEPPLVGCVISARNYSFGLLETARECVINIPTIELAKTVVACGNTSGRHIDKFKTFGLTPCASSIVKVPRIRECYASLECKVADMRMVAKYNMFILKVVKAWIDRSVKQPRTIHHAGKGYFVVASKTIKLPSKMK